MERLSVDMNFESIINEGKRPSLRSDRYQFTVVMLNLNYNVPQDRLDAQIMDLIRKDSKVSTDKICREYCVSRSHEAAYFLMRLCV